MNLSDHCPILNDPSQLEINKRFQQHIAAPKMALPGHAESYNPPPEYLMTEEEVSFASDFELLTLQTL